MTLQDSTTITLVKLNRPSSWPLGHFKAYYIGDQPVSGCIGLLVNTGCAPCRERGSSREFVYLDLELAKLPAMKGKAKTVPYNRP